MYSWRIGPTLLSSILADPRSVRAVDAAHFGKVKALVQYATRKSYVRENSFADELKKPPRCNRRLRHVGYFISPKFSGGLISGIGEPLPEMQYEQPRWTMSSHSSQTHGYVILHFPSLRSLSTSLREQSYCCRGTSWFSRWVMSWSSSTIVFTLAIPGAYSQIWVSPLFFCTIATFVFLPSVCF